MGKKGISLENVHPKARESRRARAISVRDSEKGKVKVLEKAILEKENAIPRENLKEVLGLRKDAGPAEGRITPTNALLPALRGLWVTGGRRIKRLSRLRGCRC